MAKKQNQMATFGAGCFWGVEERFRKLSGVISTAVGYMGGKIKNPTYEQVCTDTTGHAEVVHIEFDPFIIKYDQLLDLFWKSHDPTQVDRQGPDEGKQYRSVIFYHSEEQKKLATLSKEALQKTMTKKISTEIVSAGTFYRAEEYHQKYLMKRGAQTCHF